MGLKPRTEIVSKNNYKRFPVIYKCYCPVCFRQLHGKEKKCKCGQEIDWSEWM